MIDIKGVSIIYTLPYGKIQLEFTLPDGVTPDVIHYKELPRSGQDPVEEALQQPIGTRSLREIAAGKKCAVILISDGTRLCPSYLFLERLLDECNAAGIPDFSIRIIVALGMHRKHTERELEALAGPRAYRRCTVMNHSAREEDCIFLGTTKSGTPVLVNRYVAEADLRIATGNVEPHRLVGVSGGMKAVIPGCASERCIEANHSLSQRHKVEPGEADNPIRSDLEEAQNFCPVDFILNVIVNHRKEIIAAAAGSAIDAHRHLLSKARQQFLVPIQDPYDVVIASAGGYPKDLQLYQAVKTLQNAAALVKPGGTILLAAECKEQFGNGLFHYWVETIQDRRVMVQQLQEQFVLGPHKILHIHEVLQKCSIMFYSEMPEPLVELLGFRPVPDFQDAVLKMVNGLLSEGRTMKAAIMPYGAITFPTKG